MLKILKYSFFDLSRSYWSYLYLLFFLITTTALLYLSQDLFKVIVSLLNIVLILTPLIGIMLGTMYFYNSREFAELLLAQPIKRSAVFLGQYLGLSLSLSLSILLGMGIPFILFGVFNSAHTGDFLWLLLVAIMLTLIFTGLAFWVASKFVNRLKGFGLAILLWLSLAVLYDGVMLILMMLFQAYPLEKAVLAAVLLNPIDLSRILIMLRLDIAALLGFTGAVFNNFLGTTQGLILAFAALLFWICIPIFRFLHIIKHKDF